MVRDPMFLGKSTSLGPLELVERRRAAEILLLRTHRHLEPYVMEERGVSFVAPSTQRERERAAATGTLSKIG